MPLGPEIADVERNIAAYDQQAEGHAAPRNVRRPQPRQHHAVLIQRHAEHPSPLARRGWAESFA